MMTSHDAWLENYVYHSREAFITFVERMNFVAMIQYGKIYYKKDHGKIYKEDHGKSKCKIHQSEEMEWASYNSLGKLT